MAASKTAARAASRPAPKNDDTTVAIKLAGAFDRAKDSFIADVRRPAEDSVTKKVAAVGLVAGLAIGAWELAGM